MGINLKKLYLFEFTPKELQYIKDALLTYRHNVTVLKTTLWREDNAIEKLDGVIDELQALYDKVAMKPVKADNTESEERK